MAGTIGSPGDVAVKASRSGTNGDSGETSILAPTSSSSTSLVHVRTVLLCLTGSCPHRSQPIRTQCTSLTLMKGDCPLAPSQSSELVLCGMRSWSPCRSVFCVFSRIRRCVDPLHSSCSINIRLIYCSMLCRVPYSRALNRGASKPSCFWR